MTRRWSALLAASAVAGLLASCSPGATDPGLPAETAGPLTREQAESLIEEPLSDLAERLSADAPQAADFSRTGPADIGQVDGTCTFTSSVYRSEQRVDPEGWDELAGQVRPQMRAWLMDTDQLDAPERSAGAGLQGTNPHNLAHLQIHPWNGDGPEAVDGPTLGLEMSVEAPLDEAECASG